MFQNDEENVEGRSPSKKVFTQKFFHDYVQFSFDIPDEKFLPKDCKFLP